MTNTTIELVRGFNRTWTEVLGLLDQGMLHTEHTLTEARVLFELGQHNEWQRLDLRDRLAIDQSFLGRVLAGLEQRGLVATSTSELDGRRMRLTLSDAGRRAFELLDQRSSAQIGDLLAPLSGDQQRQLTEAMTVVGSLIRPAAGRSLHIRSLEAGDLGWMIQRHGALYADEYGWDTDFEALVATIVAEYHTSHRPGQESAWIAEIDRARAGCVLCCRRDAETAQLRILLVEPWARGLGIGARLVDECIDFARSAGYRKLVLWTNDVLAAARRIYQRAGFTLVDSERHHSFGHDLVGENWELDLNRSDR
jgi:DNA-binding MarR family transcriptional regulator/N-acetylglutamate synthase-like GNAT family acetyltransferase